jgi:hypothetical protein
MSLPLPPSDLLLSLYKDKAFRELNKKFVETLKYFNETTFGSLSKEDQREWDTYISTFLYIFTQPDFEIAANEAGVWANIGHVVANIVAISCMKNTDNAIRRVMIQDHNFVKLLALYSCMNDEVLNWNTLFDANADLASLCWLNFQTAPPGTLTEAAHNRCVAQLQSIPKKLTLVDFRTAPLYFQSTYMESDRKLKEFMNQAIRNKLSAIRISNCPRKNSIAIVTARWQPTTAVYKSCYHQIEALSKEFDLTLIHSGEHADGVDKHLFKEIKLVNLDPTFHKLDASAIKSNDFQLAYFPDIGMNYESVCLANLRFAPVLVTGYGHPVSTYGSLVDYFIGGRAAESETAQENYSEKLVLIPGIGAHPVFPNYTRVYPVQDTFYINCCWTSAKINHPMMTVLQEIQRRASKKVVFQFFPSWTIGRYQNAIPFTRGLSELFGEGAVAFGNMAYQLYLTQLERGQFTLDSYPFGGYNTVVDSLFVGCPVVTWEGNYFYNRASSAVMRKIGITELIAHDRREYIDKALSLIDNPPIYGVEEYRKRVSALDLRTILVDNDEPKYFVEAIKNIIAGRTICTVR